MVQGSTCGALSFHVSVVRAVTGKLERRIVQAPTRGVARADAPEARGDDE